MQASSDEVIEVGSIEVNLGSAVSYRLSTNAHRQVAGVNKVNQSVSIQQSHP
jgi:hypothetical protein